MSGAQVAAEFSRCIAVDAVRPGGSHVDFEATAEERRALASRFGILGVESLRGGANLHPAAGGRIRAKVTFAADVLQSCVATLEPVSQHIEEQFDVEFAPSQDGAPETGEVVVGVEDEDPPEPIANGQVEFGEVVAQYLALALDPYPRLPDGEPDWQQLEMQESQEEETGPSPFQVLRKLKGSG